MGFRHRPGAGRSYSLLHRRAVGQLKLEGFRDGHSMRRFIASGAVWQALACWPGNARSGQGISGAIFALTAWLALIGMWLGGGLTNWLVDCHCGIQVHRQGCRAA